MSAAYNLWSSLNRDFQNLLLAFLAMLVDLTETISTPARREALGVVEKPLAASFFPTKSWTMLALTNATLPKASRRDLYTSVDTAFAYNPANITTGAAFMLLLQPTASDLALLDTEACVTAYNAGYRYVPRCC
jgi:hypothetical protein